jgi:monoamine oxidase
MNRAFRTRASLKRSDVIVVGAGAAGLSAARELVRAQRRVIVLEASRRIGGRVMTVHPRESAVPVELGAEFVHGEAPETMRLLDEAGLATVPVIGKQYGSKNGRLSPQGPIWERMKQVFRHMSKGRKEDRSFQEFLDTRPGGRSLWREREFARGFVQGFNGAHADLISERSLAEQGDPTEGAADARRILNGYGSLIDHLAKDSVSRVRTGVTVRLVEWDSRGVRVTDTRGRSFSARCAIFTVPLPMLQGSFLAFDPEIETIRKASRQLLMGQVTRVSAVVSERFWEKKAESISFVHTPARPFNVWWTQYPVAAPVITGWSGGPPAIAMSLDGGVETMAITELARVFGSRRSTVEAKIVSLHTHDWANDRNFRGAYSYAAVGGTFAPRMLARPVENVLFFAGEATDSGSSGTVEGAIASGKRAARRVLERVR